tara:strand:+ start:183 stop:659 length:477 start_codon:yes stop_codon:yes gene_type:complete
MTQKNTGDTGDTEGKPDKVFFPLIRSNTPIGRFKDVPITFKTLAYMDLINPFTASIPEKPIGCIKGLIRVTSTVWEDLKPHSSKIIVPAPKIEELIIKFFENFWETVKDKFSEEDKWGVFGYFMTEHVQGCLGSDAWNTYSLSYWRAVAGEKNANEKK